MNCNLGVIFSTGQKYTCQHVTALCLDLYLMVNSKLDKVYAPKSLGELFK